MTFTLGIVAGIFATLFFTAWWIAEGFRKKLVAALRRLSEFESDNLPDRDPKTGRYARRVRP